MNAPNGQAQAKQGSQTKALATKQPSKTMALKDYLEVRKKSLADVLPKHMTADRVIKVALAAFSKTPKLQECTIESVALSVMQGAELGLEVGGALGHAYLVPFGNVCTLIPGYRGLIKLARQSGEIDTIEAHPVYANDKFTLRFGLNPVLEHEPNLEGDPGEMRFVYAIARMKDGGHQLEVMTRAQVDKIRAGSRNANSQMWRDNYDEASRKTVIRRICKYLPLSPEKSEALAKALELEDEREPIDVTPAGEGQSRTDALLAKAREAEAASDYVDVRACEEERPPSDSDAPPSSDVKASNGAKLKITDVP